MQKDETKLVSHQDKATQVGRLRLRTLVALRWLAIIGQTAAIAIVGYGLKYQLPLAECFGAIAASAWFNIILAFALPAQRLLKQWEAALQLAFDLLQLGFLLYLTGGMQNPFALLFIAPATIAAATLRPQWSIFVIAVTIAIIGFLHYYSLPLPWKDAGAFQLPQLYRIGIEIGVAFGVLFTAAYSWRVASEELRLADALVATQNILAREQRMAALGGLAAAAAHELGTPLATIQLTAKELARELPEGLNKEDAQLIYDQSLRCREILRNLTVHKDITDPTVESLNIGQLLEEAAARHQNDNKAIVFDLNPTKIEDELIVRRIPEVLFGLGNFIENAISYSKSKVTVSCEWDSKLVKIGIFDDGAGFDPDILPRLGEPYISSRGQGTKGAQTREGMGLGFFIAKTLLERSGAQISFGNRISPEHGAIVRAIWSRDDIEFKA